jgi:hypothetical protein
MPSLRSAGAGPGTALGTEAEPLALPNLPAILVLETCLAFATGEVVSSAAHCAIALRHQGFECAASEERLLGRSDATTCLRASSSVGGGLPAFASHSPRPGRPVWVFCRSIQAWASARLASKRSLIGIIGPSCLGPGDSGGPVVECGGSDCWVVGVVNGIYRNPVTLQVGRTPFVVITSAWELRQTWRAVREVIRK